MRVNASPLKVDPEDFRASLERHGVTALYHYTPWENVPGILRVGAILSRQAQRAAGIKTEKVHFWGHGFQALEDRICLCFVPPLGLIRREKGRMAVIEVSPEVIAWEGTCFSPRNTASSLITPEEVDSRRGLESFEALFRSSRSSALVNRSAEVLVAERIPMGCFERVVFPTRQALRATLRERLRIRLARAFSCRWEWTRFSWDSDGVLFP
jgi:hypothetical protein